MILRGGPFDGEDIPGEFPVAPSIHIPIIPAETVLDAARAVEAWTPEPKPFKMAVYNLVKGSHPFYEFKEET